MTSHEKLMSLSHSDFLTDDINDFAEFLGLDGIDGDLFYETYYHLNINDYYDEDDYRETNKFECY